MKKFDGYFAGNKDRMHYSVFKELNLPTGSGAVESAIRRVINLRLEGAGIFWTPEMAEVMLFLRSQFLCGRWSIVIGNLVDSPRKMFMQYWPPMPILLGFSRLLDLRQNGNAPGRHVVFWYLAIVVSAEEDLPFVYC